MKKLITIEEFENVYNDLDFRHLALYDSGANALTSFNAPGENRRARKFNEIKKYLLNPNTPDGVYIIKTKDKIKGSNQATIDYHIVKGNPGGSPEAPATIQPIVYNQPQQNNSADLTIDQVIELKSKVARLEIENENLRAKIEELEDELEDQSLDEAPGSTTTDFISSLAENLTPLLDKFLNQRDKKLQIEEARLTYQIKKDLMGEAPEEDQELPEEEHNTITFEEFTGMSSDQLTALRNEQPEAYNELMSNYQNYIYEHN